MTKVIARAENFRAHGASPPKSPAAHGITRGAARARLAGISGARYEILMLASRADGLSIGEVAARMHRSGAFITLEANKRVVAERVACGDRALATLELLLHEAEAA